MLAALCVLIVISIAGAAAEKPAAAAIDAKTTHVDTWLALGPFPAPLPAFAAGEKQKFGAAKLLAYDEIPLSSMKPVENAAQALLFGAKASWRSAAADTNGVSIPVGGATPAIAYLAAYVEVPRWTKISVNARSSEPFAITIDGVEVVKDEKAARLKDRASASTGAVLKA